MSSQRQKPKGIPDLDLQLSHSGNEQFRKVSLLSLMKILYFNSFVIVAMSKWSSLPNVSYL